MCSSLVVANLQIFHNRSATMKHLFLKVQSLVSHLISKNSYNSAAGSFGKKLERSESGSRAAPARTGSLRSTRLVRTVQHSANHTCRATLLQLSWAGCHVGPALYGLRFCSYNNKHRNGIVGIDIQVHLHFVNIRRGKLGSMSSKAIVLKIIGVLPSFLFVSWC